VRSLLAGFFGAFTQSDSYLGCFPLPDHIQGHFLVGPGVTHQVGDQIVHAVDRLAVNADDDIAAGVEFDPLDGDSPVAAAQARSVGWAILGDADDQGPFGCR